MELPTVDMTQIQSIRNQKNEIEAQMAQIEEQLMKVRKEKEARTVNEDLAQAQELAPADRYLSNQINDRRAVLETQG